MAKNARWQRLWSVVFPCLCVVSWALTTGCGGNECGTGTVEVDGVCNASTDVLICAPGFKPIGNKCEPEDDWISKRCGSNTAYDAVSRTCKGIGGGSTCDSVCGVPQGAKICLSGRVFEGISYLKGTTSNTIKKGDGATVKVYDPIAFVTNPSVAPLATGTIYNDDGCYIVNSVPIPASNFFMIGAMDTIASGTKFAQATIGHTPTYNQNSDNLDVLAFKKTAVDAWGSDILKDGSMIMWFRDAKGDGVSGVKPLLDQVGPPWAGMQVHFLDADLAAAPYVVSGTSTTTSSGLVAVRKAAVKNYSGEKTGCKIEQGLGGSSPNTLFFRIFDVEGC